MTEQTQALPEIPAASAAAIAKMPADTQTAARAAMAAAGYRVDAQGQVRVPVVTAPAVTLAAAPNAERVAQWRSLEKGWTGDRAILVAQALKSGVDLTTSPEAEAAISEVSLAANRAAATQAAVSPPVAANDYGNISWPNAKDIPATELGKQDTLWKQSLFAAGVPKQFVQVLIDAAFASAKTYESKLGEYATDDDKVREQAAMQIRLREEAHRVRSLPDTDVAKLAQIALDALPKDFRAVLDENHALSSAESFAALSLIGKAISQRKAK